MAERTMQSATVKPLEGQRMSLDTKRLDWLEQCFQEDDPDVKIFESDGGVILEAPKGK